MDITKIELMFPCWYRKNLLMSMLKNKIIAYRIFFESNSIKILFWYGEFCIFNEMLAIYNILKSLISNYGFYNYKLFAKNREEFFNNEYVKKMINFNIIEIKYNYHLYSKKRFQKKLVKGSNWEKFSKDINNCIENEIEINYLNLLEEEKRIQRELN